MAGNAEHMIPFTVSVKVGPYQNTIEGYIEHASRWADLTESEINAKLNEAFRLARITVIKTRRKVGHE